jgi:hypothetical protein
MGIFYRAQGLLWLLMQFPEVAIFLELTPNAYGGWFSGIVSAIGFLVALHLVFD